MGSDEEDGEDDDEDDESDDDEYTHPSNVVIEEIMDAQVGDAQITAMSAAKVIQHCMTYLPAHTVLGWHHIVVQH